MEQFDAVEWLQVHEDVPLRGREFRVHLKAEHLGLFLRIANIASWQVHDLGVGQDSFQHPGYQGSVEGLLTRTCREIEVSKGIYPKEMHPKFDNFIANVNEMLNGDAGECVLSIRDPSGLSMVAEQLKPSVTDSCSFLRSVAEDRELRLRDDAYFEYPVPSAQVSSVDEVASLIGNAKRVVALTGAGVSVESGITPFRNPSDGDAGSLWGTFDARKMTQQGFNSDPEITQAWWDMKRFVHNEAVAAQPNPAHKLFGALNRAGRLEAVVTQNIDSMHQRGGVDDGKVIELHGDMRRIICSDQKTTLNPIPYLDGLCRFSCAWSDIDTVDVPRCPECGCPLRTETVMFGQPMPEGVMGAATEAVANADLLIIIGSTLIVEPANTLPAEALCRRTPVVIINFDATKYDDHATALVRQKAGAFLREVTCKLELTPPVVATSASPLPADTTPLSIGSRVYLHSIGLNVANPRTEQCQDRAKLPSCVARSGGPLDSEKTHGDADTSHHHFVGEWDGEGVYFYQAFNESIASWAVMNQRFGGPHFCPDRMTWIKPSFAWVLYRAGYGFKDRNQSRILKVKVSHEAVTDILGSSVLAHDNASADNCGRVQWDPARSLEQGSAAKTKRNMGNTIEPHRIGKRAIQIGMRGELSHHYVRSVISIEDVTTLAHEVHAAHSLWDRPTEQESAIARLRHELPTERVYFPHCLPKVFAKLRMCSLDQG